MTETKRQSRNLWGVFFEHDDGCEADFIVGPMMWGPCGCADRLTEAEMQAANTTSMDSKTDGSGT